MTTYRLDDLSRHPSAMGRRCDVPVGTGTWRGSLAGYYPTPRTTPGHYVVTLRVRGQLRHTPALPGDTEITIYPKEAP